MFTSHSVCRKLTSFKAAIIYKKKQPINLFNIQNRFQFFSNIYRCRTNGGMRHDLPNILNQRFLIEIALNHITCCEKKTDFSIKTI